MKNAQDEIVRTTHPDFDLARMPDDDAKTFEMLGRGDTTGVFQLESEGMRRVVTELKPTAFDDIVALVALYRPGPMEWIPQYIGNKHGRTKPRYLHQNSNRSSRRPILFPCIKSKLCGSRGTSPDSPWLKRTSCARLWKEAKR